MNDNKPNEQAKPAGSEAVSDILVASGFILFAMLMFIGATQFTYKTAMGYITSAAFTPVLLSIFVFLLSIVLIIQTLRKNKAVKISLSEWFKSARNEETVRRSLVLMVITGAYIILVGRINFLLLTFIFLLVIYYYLKIGKPVRVLLYSLLNALLIAYVVPVIYQMPLP